MRKTCFRFVVIGLLLYVGYTLARTTYLTPGMALGHIVDYAKKGDETGIEVCIDPALNRTSTIKKSFLNTLSGEEILDFDVIGTTYNEDRNLAVVDVVIDKMKNGEHRRVRNFYFMSYIPGLSWNLYDICGYSRVDTARSQCETATKQVGGLASSGTNLGTSANVGSGIQNQTGFDEPVFENNTGDESSGHYHLDSTPAQDPPQIIFDYEALRDDEDTYEEETPLQTIYSDAEILRMARDYYYARYGAMPPLATVDSSDEDYVTVWLYEDMGDHTSTWDYITVNRFDATGTNVMGDPVDLLNPYATTQDSWSQNNYDQSDWNQNNWDQSWDNYYEEQTPVTSSQNYRLREGDYDVSYEEGYIQPGEYYVEIKADGGTYSYGASLKIYGKNNPRLPIHRYMLGGAESDDMLFNKKVLTLTLKEGDRVSFSIAMGEPTIYLTAK